VLSSVWELRGVYGVACEDADVSVSICQVRGRSGSGERRAGATASFVPPSQFTKETAFLGLLQRDTKIDSSYQN
jgi:hypothetical protein